MNVDIFSNQILLESVILKDLKLEDITYLKKLLIIKRHHQWKKLYVQVYDITVIGLF